MGGISELRKKAQDMANGVEATEVVESPPDETVEAVATPGTEETKETAPAAGGEESTKEGAAPAGAAPAAKVVGDAAAGEGGAPAAYTPSYKYKAAGVEREIDDWAKPLMKDKETETKMRELFERSTGLDAVKEKATQLSTTVQTQARQLEGVREIVALRDKEDLTDFFEKIRLTPERILGWVKEQARLHAMSPEDRNVYNENRRVQRENESLRTQMEGTLSERDEIEATQTVSSLRAVLSQPDISAVVANFDAQQGKEGAFMAAVVRHAASEEILSQGQRKLTAEEATREFITLYGLRAQGTPPSVPKPNVTPEEKPAAAAAPAAAVKAPAKVVKPPKPAVLPTLPSSASSAASSKPRSIADLRKLRRDMTTNQ